MLVSSSALAQRAACFSECKAVFRDISFNNPLIGIAYLVCPVIGAVFIFGHKVKSSEQAQKVKSDNIGYLFYFLAGVALLIVLVLEFE